MDDSFGAAMAGLVIEDASRMSGARFADARGTGVARRVRTRRRVRAAGMGGASAVAVGAIALGASHVPWGTKAVPAMVPTDCATPWPSPSPSEAASPFLVQKNYADYLVDTWMVSDAASGEPLFTLSPAEVGKTWKVLYPSGLNEVVPYSAPGEVALEVPGVGAVVVSIAANDGATEITVSTPALPPDEPSPRPSDDCYTASPTPSADASPSPEPSPSPELSRPVIATVVTKPEDVLVGANPFQCGFAFPTDSSAADGLWTLSAEQIPAADVNARLADYSPEPPQALGTAPVFTVTMFDHFAATLGSITTVGMEMIDPALVANRAEPSGFSLIQDATFVAVVNGTVVGTIADTETPQVPMPLLTEMLGTVPENTVTLLNPDTAFTACPGITLGNDWTPYVVVGDAAIDAGGANYGPVYGWLKLGE